MPKVTVELTKNTSLSLTLLCEILGISKSEFLRMASIEYAVRVLKEGNIAEANKQYICSLLQLAIQESSDTELDSRFKQEIIKIIPR